MMLWDTFKSSLALIGGVTLVLGVYATFTERGKALADELAEEQLKLRRSRRQPSIEVIDVEATERVA